MATVVTAVSDDRGRRLPAVRLIQLAVRHFRRKSSIVCVSDFCCCIPWWVVEQKISLDYRTFLSLMLDASNTVSQSQSSVTVDVHYGRCYDLVKLLLFSFYVTIYGD